MVTTRPTYRQYGEKEEVMNRYDIYVAGGEKIKTVYDTCISKVCQSFIETLEKEARYNVMNSYYATIRYTDNYTILGDFVILRR